MNYKEKNYDGNIIKQVTRIGTLLMLALLLVFFIITCVSTNHLASQVELLSEHPFTVIADVNEIRTDLALMRVRTERLQAYNQPEDVEKVRLALEELNTEMEELLSEVDALYLGPDEDIEALRSGYREIQQAHERLLNFAKLSTSTTADITVYEEENLYSLYNSFEVQVQKILSYVKNTQHNIFASADSMGRNTMTWSVIIILATAIALLCFQRIIGKINHQLYEKNCQFAMLSDTVDEAFLIFENNADRCEFVSGSAEKVMGIAADDLFENRMLFYQYINDETAAKIRSVVQNETILIWEDLVEYQHPKNLQASWLQLRIYRVGEQEKKIIVTLIDRTRERQINQALEDALISAQNANDAKRDFLSRMSHEIRTPMNAIIGMTTIAAASIEDRSRVEYCLEKIGFSSKHLLMLLNDILDMSRIESNHMQLNHEPFDLFQFISGFVSVVYIQAEEKGIEFIERTTGFTEQTTYVGDSLRLNQILLNLTSNAIKFTPGGGKINLEVTRLPMRGKKNWIRFVVSDTGIGMDEDALSRLYTPFEQADASIARKYGGTGLGMSITQNLIALMGGTISVTSKPGEGTSFTVELPFDESELVLQPMQSDEIRALNVLVVDDEQDACEHTALLLQKMEIHAEWVLNGIEAVARVEKAWETEHAFDVCFIDWKMPDMDGIETTRRIREKVGNDTPVIIISAYDWREIETEARAAGANAFIAKPLFASSLYNVLVNVTNRGWSRKKSDSQKMEQDEKKLKGLRILVAEDNIINMEILELLLHMNGAAVECVDNGQKAVDRFVQMKPDYYDAILMDVQMPVLNGCKATMQIRACERKDAETIPIIAVTADAFAEDISAVMSAGMNAHISKPIDVRQLCNTLLDLCKAKPVNR